MPQKYIHARHVYKVDASGAPIEQKFTERQWSLIEKQNITHRDPGTGDLTDLPAMGWEQVSAPKKTPPPPLDDDAGSAKKGKPRRRSRGKSSAKS